jgi:hypothetical protein
MRLNELASGKVNAVREVACAELEGTHYRKAVETVCLNETTMQMQLKQGANTN